MSTNLIRTRTDFKELCSGGVIDVHDSATVENGVNIVVEGEGRPIRIAAGARIEAGAVIYSGAVIGENTVVSRGCSIGGDVLLGDRNSVLDQSVITGRVEVGDDNKIGPFSSIGQPAQHRTASSDSGLIVIGSRNIVREFTTINRPTEELTIVGNDCYLMAYVHVPHDAVIDDFVTITNASQIAGHVTIHHHVTLGLGATVHQYTIIGAGAMIAMGSVVSRDVPPYGLVGRVGIRGLNRIGMDRLGIDAGQMQDLEDWYKLTKGQVSSDDLTQLTDRWWYQDMAKFVKHSNRSRYVVTV